MEAAILCCLPASAGKMQCTYFIFVTYCMYVMFFYPITTLTNVHRPMKNSDINLMDDNQNEWDDEDPDCRRLRVRNMEPDLFLQIK